MSILNSKAFPFLLFHTMLLFLVVYSRCTLKRKYDNTVMETRFKSWLQHNNKHYENRDEWMLRFGIYQANLDFIDYINSQNLTYKLGDNEFADLTNEEFRSLYVGRLIFPPSSNHTQNSTAPKSHQQVPTELDWRKKGAVTNVKVQGDTCGIFHGSCGTKLDHDLIIVGYGEESGVKYWILKNSWGPNWGEAGYMRIVREGGQAQGTCGVAMSPSYPIV